MEKIDPKTQYAEIRYRSKRYGTWQPCRITIPPGTPLITIHKFIAEDLKERQIGYSEMEIVKITNI